MKAMPMTTLWGRRLIGPILGALLLLATFALLLPSRAEAGLKIRAGHGQTQVQVSLGNDGPRGWHGPDRHGMKIRLTKVDRTIARRLARQTYHGKRVLLDLRRAGYSWNRIGRILQIRPRLVRQTVREVKWGTTRGNQGRKIRQGTGTCPANYR